MKEIKKYQAKDGIEFYTIRECADYEQLIDTVDNIMSRLPELPQNDGCNFANGHGYIQHDKEIIMSVWNDLLDEMGKKIKHDWVEQSKDMKCHPSWVGRLVGDYDIRPLSKAWHRMNCINKENFREYGQPYYAENPHKADNFDIYSDLCDNCHHNKGVECKCEGVNQ